MQLARAAVGWVVTATIHDTGGAIDERSIRCLHAVVHPLLPREMVESWGQKPWT